MTKKVITKKINNRKVLLNLLLRYFNPSNPFVIYLSQNLDKHIYIYQRAIYKRNKQKKRKNQPYKKAS